MVLLYIKTFGWLLLNFSASLNYVTASKIHQFNLFSSSAVFRCLLLSFCKFQKHSWLPTFPHDVTSSYSLSCAKHLELTALNEQFIVNYHFLKKVHLRSLFPYATDRTIYIFIQDSTLYIFIWDSPLYISIRDSTLYISMRQYPLQLHTRQYPLYHYIRQYPLHLQYHLYLHTSTLYIFVQNSTFQVLIQDSTL